MSKNWRLEMPSPESYCIDRVLFDVQHDAEARRRFIADPVAYVRELPISEQRKAQLSSNAPLYLAGANPYMLRAHCLAMSIPEEEYLAQMRAVIDER